jgi:hypothetical protein
VNSKYQFAYYALWIAHPVLQAAVVYFMVRRKLYRTFPYFFAYLLAEMSCFAVVFPIYLNLSYFAYFYAYWASAAVGVVLGFKVIHEIFVDIFRPYHTLKDLGSVLFKWSGLVMVLVAGVVSASTPVTPQGPVVQGIMTLQRSVRVVQCGLVLFLLVFSSYLGIYWRQRSFGIALGFGLFASVELGLGALNMSGLTRFHAVTVGLLNMVAYNSAIVVWLVYSVFKCSERDAAAANLLRPQRWERSLTDLRHPVPADSLIPMFEGMVDRAFSKTTRYSADHAPAIGNELVTGSAPEYADETGITPALSSLTRSS